jgi:hypothetical protein
MIKTARKYKRMVKNGTKPKSNMANQCLLIILFIFPLFGNVIAQQEVSQKNTDTLIIGDASSDSTLIAIRDGFDTRVAKLFDAQKEKTFNEMGKSGWNASQRYAYPRIEYATANLWQGQDIDSANLLLVEYGEYYINNPEQVLHRDNFHWHSEMALRLIEMFGQNGTKTPGLLKPETEDKILEAVWLYCKRMEKDQKPINTKAEADTKESDTWYIYESENHHSQSFTTQWHFAKLAKDRPGFKDRIYDDGKNALEHYNEWNEYLKMYFTERAKKGIFIEMMSRDYNEKTFKGMFNIYDFATDPDLKRKAGFYLDLYFTYWGEEQINGISGGGKSRLYQDMSPGTSEYGYLFFGIGDKPRFESTILSAMTTSYRPPLVVVDIACDLKGRGNYEVRQRAMGLAEPGHYQNPIYHMRTDSGGIVRYSYCTPDFIVGAAMFDARPNSDWALISSQNPSRGVMFASSADAGILPQCEKIRNNRAYNTQWSVQEKGTQICQKLKSNSGAGRTMVWFSADGLSDPLEENNWVFAESQGAYAALRVVDGGYTWEDQSRRAKGKWLVCDNEYSPLILEVDQKSNYKSFEDFRSKILGNAMDYSESVLTYTGLYGDTFTFFADYSKPPKINNEPVNYAPEKVYDSPFLKSDWNSGIVHIQKGTRSVVLDFN